MTDDNGTVPIEFKGRHDHIIELRTGLRRSL